MGDVRRRGIRIRPVDLDDLARQLPDHLREFPSFNHPTDMLAHWDDVAGWLNHAAPGVAGDMTPFLVIVGLDAATFYEAAMSQPTTTRPTP